MQPAANNVFVEKIETKKGKFEVVSGQTRYQVTAIGKEVSSCKMGDFVLFSDSREYQDGGETIISVHDDNIEGVAHV